jgi:hypothetical protein
MIFYVENKFIILEILYLSWFIHCVIVCVGKLILSAFSQEARTECGRDVQMQKIEVHKEQEIRKKIVPTSS